MGQKTKPITIPSEPLAAPDNSPYALWNGAAARFTSNCQCFAYNAWDSQTAALPPGNYDGYIPVPGETGGHPMPEPFTPSSFRAALTADGVTVLSHHDQREIVVPEGKNLIAAVQDPDGRLYHFLRRDEASGDWYHKLDWEQPVSNRDLAGRIIADPHTADLGPHTVFVGYGLAPKEGIPLKRAIRPVDPESGNGKMGRMAGVAGLAAPYIVGAGVAAATLITTGSVANAKTEGAGATEDVGNILSLREDPAGPKSRLGRAAYKVIDWAVEQGNHLAGINTRPSEDAKPSKIRPPEVPH